MDIKKTAEIIKNGGIVAFPTETVYGMGCDATNAEAVQRIYQIKGRTNNPLSIIFGDLTEVKKYAMLDKDEEAIATKYWPGPLTMVLRSRENLLPLNVTGGLKTLGIRIPDHPVPAALLAATGLPLIATSVNKAGEKELNSFFEIKNNFGSEIDVILEDARMPQGKASTVVQVKDGRVNIIRQGSLSIIIEQEKK